ncbi:MAG: hypothetical protein AAGF11_32590 [Myxococcota bacterium]
MTSSRRQEKMDPTRLDAAIHDGDSAAFRELYRHYLPDLRYGVRAFIHKVPRLRPYEEEIVSRSWVRLLARDRKWLRSYDPRKASFGYFMSMVGANTAWQMASLKEFSARPQIHLFDREELARQASDLDIEALAMDRQLLAKLDERLQHEFSERELVLFEEVIVRQRSAKDVARDFGISADAVWTATSRLRKKITVLRQDLDPRAPPAPNKPGHAIEALLLYLSISLPTHGQELGSHDSPPLSFPGLRDGAPW